MRIIRKASENEIYKTFKCYATNNGVWVECYSVGFKKPRGKKIRWVLTPEATTPTEASRMARTEQKKGEHEYGISTGIFLYVVWDDGTESFSASPFLRSETEA